LTEEFGCDDTTAGVMYGSYGAFISIYGVIFGSQVDLLGVKQSLQIGFALTMVSNVWMALTVSLNIVYFNLFVLLPTAGALGIPVLTVGVRRLTDETNRSFAFGIFYAMMNVGALLCGPSIDYFSIYWKHEDYLSGHRMILLTCATASFLGLMLSTFFLGDKRLSEPEMHVKESVSSILHLFRSKPFLRFFAFSILMVNLRSIFRHLDATLPKYLVRVHGNKVNKGLIFAINPTMIILLVPILTSITASWDTFLVIKLGALISSTSAVFLCVSESIWAAVWFVLQLSLGEALWSPRFLNYQVSVAPEGKEAAFMALANAPLFLSKFPAGWLSGYLLATLCPPRVECSDGSAHCREWLKSGLATCTKTFCLDCKSEFAGKCDRTCDFCPSALKIFGEVCADSLEDCPPQGARNTELMWLIISILTVSTPILLHLFEGHIREKERK